MRKWWRIWYSSFCAKAEVVGCVGIPPNRNPSTNGRQLITTMLTGASPNAAPLVSEMFGAGLR